MARYFVSYMCVYSETVNADTPEEAADIVANNCPCDVDGEPEVVMIDGSD